MTANFPLRPLLLLFFVLQLASARAQDGVFPTVGARSYFLGGTGLNATGAEAVWTNPAGLAGAAPGLQGTTLAELRFGLSELTATSLGASYHLENSGFGLQLATLGFDTYRETRVGLAYGRQIGERFRLGGEFTGFGTSTAGYASSFDVTFGLGLQVMILPELHVGTRVFSPLRTERLPEEYLPQLLAFGVSYRPTKQLLIDTEVHQSPDFPLRFRAGLEYLPAEELSIRLGVVTEVTELSFGLGYRVWDRVEFTAGARWHEVLGVWPGVGVRYVE